MKITINGYSFNVLADSVYPIGKINILESGYLEAVQKALEFHTDAYINRASYVYLYKGRIPNTYKIGMSYNPHQRIKDCNNAVQVLWTLKIGDRSLTYRYETAMHNYYRFCSASMYGTGLNDEWFVMTDEQAKEIIDCQSVEDLRWLLGVNGQYEKCLILDRPFDPNKFVKSVPRWPEVERLMLHYNRMLNILKRPAPSGSPFGNYRQRNMAGLISEASEYDE